MPDSIAEEVLAILGGTKFIEHVGACDIKNTPNSVTFRMTAGRAMDKIDTILIVKNNDRYAIEVSSTQRDVKRKFDMHPSQLKRVFINMTGIGL